MRSATGAVLKKMIEGRMGLEAKEKRADVKENAHRWERKEIHTRKKWATGAHCITTLLTQD